MMQISGLGKLFSYMYEQHDWLNFESNVSSNYHFDECLFKKVSNYINQDCIKRLFEKVSNKTLHSRKPTFSKTLVDNVAVYDASKQSLKFASAYSICWHKHLCKLSKCYSKWAKFCQRDILPRFLLFFTILFL